MNGHSIKDCFILKGKIHDLINSGIISFSKDSVKAPINQVSVAKETQNVSESQEPDEDEILDSTEEWTILENKGAKKRREHANAVKTTEQKAVRAG